MLLLLLLLLIVGSRIGIVVVVIPLSIEVTFFFCLAQSFVQAEMEDRTLNAAGFHENINEAIKCYERAIEVEEEYVV